MRNIVKNYLFASLTLILAFNSNSLSQIPTAQGGTGLANPQQGSLLLGNDSNPMLLLQPPDPNQLAINNFDLKWLTGAAYPTWEIDSGGAGTISGGGTDKQVTVFNGSTSIAGYSGFTYDPNIPRLMITNGTPSLPSYISNDFFVVAGDPNSNTAINITAGALQRGGVIISSPSDRVLSGLYGDNSNNSVVLFRDNLDTLVADANTVEIKNTKSLTIPEQSSAPPTPETSKGLFYFGNDGRPHAINSAGMDMLLGGVSTAATMQLVGEQTLTIAQTSVTFSNLDLARDQEYRLVGTISNASASTIIISLFYNGDTTATNYDEQGLGAGASTVNASRANDARISAALGNSGASFSTEIRRDSSGYTRSFTNTNRDTASSLVLNSYAHIWTNTANVTSLTIQSSVASSFATGSSFRIYKIGPPNTVPATMTSAMQLVQKQTVSGSAVTSIVFSNLDLDRDEQYQLNFDWLSAVNTGSVALEFNGDTTATNYYKESLYGSASSANASNANNSNIIDNLTSLSGKFRIDISREPNGIVRAAVYRSWNTNTNTSLGISAIEWTTAANVTTITLRSTVASGIAVGSRATLYRISSTAPAIAGPVPSDMEGVRFVYTDPNTITLTPNGPDGKAYVNVVDSYNNEIMVALSSSLTASFAISGCGGRTTGTDSVGGWYVWLWTRNAGLSPCLTLDTSQTSPTAPSGGVFKRFVFFIRNGNSSGAANIVPFLHNPDNREFYYTRNGTDDSPYIIDAATATTMTAIDLTGYCPSSSSVAFLRIRAQTTDTTGSAITLFTNSSASDGFWDEVVGGASSANYGQNFKSGEIRMPLTATLSTSVYYKWTAASSGRDLRVIPHGCSLN